MHFDRDSDIYKGRLHVTIDMTVIMLTNLAPLYSSMIPSLLIFFSPVNILYKPSFELFFCKNTEQITSEPKEKSAKIIHTDLPVIDPIIA